MGLTGAADDQAPLEDAPQLVNSDANANNDADGNDDALERRALEEWLRLAAKHHFDAADEALRRRYFPAVRAVVAGQARGLDSPYVQAVMELMHHLHSQGAEPRKVVPLRAGGGMVGAFNEIALGKLMPTLRALSTTNGSH